MVQILKEGIQGMKEHLHAQLIQALSSTQQGVAFRKRMSTEVVGKQA